LYFDKCHLVKIPACHWSLKVTQLRWIGSGFPIRWIARFTRRIPSEN
jgi:hypothetical protein